ncbi:MAG: T9SS type A sorting domain-containing protein [Bacteroidota bacterium]
MHKNRFHDTWVLPLLVWLLTSSYLIAQCPTTKSASFAMVEQGLPSRERLQPIDLLANPADTAFYKNLQLSQNHFLCFEVGIQEVTLSGTDPKGDAFACEEFVWVYDSVFLCSNTIRTPRVVAGKILTETGVPVPDIAIGLASNNLNYFKGTDESGTFFFEDFETENYQLKPGVPFVNNVRNGVSTFDVLLLQKHILGLRLLDSPYKIIAADLNSSGDITAFDMLLLRQLILSMIEEFPNTPSWKYVDASYGFTDPKNPLQEDYPEFIDLDMEQLGPQLDNRFVAIKMGDFNNSVRLGTAARQRSREGKPFVTLQSADQLLSVGETTAINLNFTETQTISGLQFALQLDSDKLTILSVESNVVPSNDYRIGSDGKLLVSSTYPTTLRFEKGESLLKIRIQAKAEGQLSENIRLTPQILQSEVYQDDTELSPLALTWKAKTSATDLRLFDNYPNPFSTQTNLPFYLSTGNEVTLTIFDGNGRIIEQLQQYFNQGHQTIELTDVFPKTGLYFYQLSTPASRATGKLNAIF